MIGSYILNYKILQKIGEGGMGTVYLAKHSTIGRMVAVKVLLPEFTQNLEIKNRFINEAKTLSKLSHKNIVTLFDFAEKDGNLFIIMEYVEGVSLDKHKADFNKTDEKRALNIFSQILDGFEYAHSKGIVHRDIKPSNIILSVEGIPKILDFGIAKIFQGDFRMTKTGAKMGSVLYMSPEQVLGRDVDLRTDIYSLGITLYEILAGRNPYDNAIKSEYEIQNAIINNPIPYIIKYNPSISENTQRVIYIATAKNPTDRFNSCVDFKKALGGDEVLSSNYRQVLNKNDDVYSITQTRPQSTDRTVIQNQPIYSTQQGHIKRNNTVIYLLISVIALATIIGVILYTKYNSKPDIEVSTEKRTVEKTEPTTIKKENNTEKEKTEIINVVNDMLNSWQNKNIEGFFKHLSNDYEYQSSDGVYRTYSSRKNKAYEIFDNNRYIKMTTWDMTVDLNGNEAVVRFMQRYNSTTVNETTVKKFYLRKTNNTWQAYKELSGYN